MKTFNKAFSRFLMTLAVAGLGLVLTPASAQADFLDFTVDESVVELTGTDFLADRLNGGYIEVITFDGVGGFEATVVGDFTQYFHDGLSQSAISLLGDNYGVWGGLIVSGDVTDLGGGLFSFELDTAIAEVYLDPNLDTTKTLPGTGGGLITVGNFGDDDLLLSANNIDSSFGLLVTGVGGFFDLVFSDVFLTGIGQLYWPDLPTLELSMTVDGDFDTFDVEETQNIEGDVDLRFAVPEPASLTLLGMGLMGSAMAVRRRRNAARSAKK